MGVYLKFSIFVLLGLPGFVPTGRSGEKMLNVLSFGARGDGVTLNTSFIQAAIDSATAMGGGVVVVPRGKFLSGTLVLKSNVTLQLREGATLLGSLNPADYQHLAFILAEEQENISITGRGTIDGQGRKLALYLDSLFYAGKLDSSQYNLRRKRPENRPGDLKISDCKNVRISGITVKNACGWVQTYRLCEELVIDSIRVESDAYWNNDGIDIADCKKVRITHCFVNSADDGIRPAFVFDDVNKLDLNTITIGKANNHAPVILSHVTGSGIQKVITPGFAGNPVKTISCGDADLHAQASQIVYLSGTDKDHTVNWDFFINTGQNSGSWNKIAVPSNWELQGFGTYNYFQDTKNPDEQGLYKCHFRTDAAWSKKKVFIVFEGAMTDTKVMINGLLAGPIHQGGYYRFKYDITKLLKTGDNLLEVTVSKKSANASINLAERRADFWQFGGIYRPVYLEILPANYIDHMAIDAKADGSMKVDVYAPDIKNDNLITAQLQTLEGQKIGKEIIQEAVNGGFPVSLKGSYKTIVPWNPEFPRLYNLVVSIKAKDGRVIHTVTQRFGFRTMELRLHDGIYVNGKKVMLKGVCRHSEWPESGRTLSKAISIMDVNLMKDMNMNAVRMSHYPPDSHFLDVCDSLGLFVLDELTGWQNKYDSVVGKRLVKEMVVRDVNHPAIIFWDNGNEGGWNTALDDQFRLYDPQNRVVLHPWAKFNGTDTRHYPDYNYVVNSALYGNDVFFPTEFMHGNYDGGAGAGLEDFWDAILKHPYGAGGFIWVFADGGIRRVDEDSTMDTANDSAPDGILGPHREKEGSFYTIKELWSPVAINRKWIPHNFDGRIAVENRYIYTNLNQCQFKWRLVSFPAASDTGTRAITGAQRDLPKFDLAPGEKGFLELDLPQNWANYDALYLTAVDPHGRELFTWTWPILLPDQIKKPVFSSSAPTITADDSATSLIVHSSGINYFFNKVTGQLQKVVNGKNEISLAGPVEAGFNHQLVTLKSYVDGANYIVEPIYEGDTYFNVKWTFAPGKLVELQYEYTLEKHWSQQTGVDFAGITFNFPEEKITGMKWLGRGPYRVWKNRLKGQQFGVWHKDYNNTITGANWNYPEFKGYHADLYWVVIENKESPFTVYTDDQSIFLQMLKPDHSKYEHASLKAAFPDGDIGFLNSIAPIGTRFQSPSLLGPESQKNIQLNYGMVKGTLWFDFR